MPIVDYIEEAREGRGAVQEGTTPGETQFNGNMVACFIKRIKKVFPKSRMHLEATDHVTVRICELGYRAASDFGEAG